MANRSSKIHHGFKMTKTLYSIGSIIVNRENRSAKAGVVENTCREFGSNLKVRWCRFGRSSSQAWVYRGREIFGIRRAMAFGDAMTSVYTYWTRPRLARVISERKLGRHCCCCCCYCCCCCCNEMADSGVTSSRCHHIIAERADHSLQPLPKHSLSGNLRARQGLRGLFMVLNPKHLRGIHYAPWVKRMIFFS